MKQILLTILITVIMTATLIAGEAVEMTLQWQEGSLELLSQRKLDGTFKKRRSKGVAGPASDWSWQLLNSSEQVVAEKRIADPTFISSPERNDLLDSVTFVIVVPLTDGGEEVRLVYTPGNRQYKAGDAPGRQIRSLSNILGSFSIEGSN